MKAKFLSLMVGCFISLGMVPGLPGAIFGPVFPPAAVDEAEAQSYLSTVGTTNAVRRDRVNNFVKALKAAGVWSSLDDACLLSTNYNVATGNPRTLRLAYGTNTSLTSWNGDGMTFNGSSSKFEMPVSVSGACSMVVPLAQGTDAIPSDEYEFIYGVYSATGTNGGGMRLYNRFGPRIVVEQGGDVWEVDGNVIYEPAGPIAFVFNNDIRSRIYTLSFDNNTNLNCFVDRWQASTNANVDVVLSNSLTRAVIGAGLGSAGYSAYWDGTADLVMVFDKALSAAEELAVERAIRWLDLAQENWVVIGDSLSAYHPDHIATNQIWGYRMSTNRVVADQAKVWIIGRSGFDAHDYTVSYHNERAARFAPDPAGPAQRGVALVNFGINDVLPVGAGGRGETAENTISKLQAVWQLCASNQFEVWASTMATADTVVWLTNSTLPEYRQLNESIRTNHMYYDRLIRWDALFAEGAVDTYTFDGLHLSNNGNQLLSDLVRMPDLQPAAEVFHVGPVAIACPPTNGVPIYYTNYPPGTLAILTNGAIYTLQGTTWTAK